MADTRDITVRFAERFMPEPMSGCWLWTGAATKGYGIITHGGRITKAHRVSYELHRGPIPPGLFVCHRCDNPGCVNPDHLFLGTIADNNADKMAKGRQRCGEATNLAKLTAAQVLEIRASNLPRLKIAATFGISRSCVQQIRRRSLWKHLP